MTRIVVRGFHRGEEEELLGILDGAFGCFMGSAQPRRVMASRFFEPGACFIAEEDGSPVGCVALTSLPREKWYVVRYLAVKSSTSRVRVAERLLGKVLEYAESQRPEFIKATTPAIQPYVDIYKRSGFQPVRRDFRIVWDLEQGPNGPDVPIIMRKVTEETAREAAGLFIETLASHWGWRTAEQGGAEAVERSFIEGMKNGEQWTLGESDGQPVGMVGIIPDF